MILDLETTRTLCPRVTARPRISASTFIGALVKETPVPITIVVRACDREAAPQRELCIVITRIVMRPKCVNETLIGF
jgi:hypothetical protein